MAAMGGRGRNVLSRKLKNFEDMAEDMVWNRHQPLRRTGGPCPSLTLGGLVFDASEARALPLSRAALDHCVGAQLNGARFSHVARAVRLVPGKSLRKRLRREA